MAKGYWSKILRVDLSSRKINVEEPDEKFYRTYLGGRGIIAHYLLKEVPTGCDPLGPENVLIFAASVLSGAAIPGAGRISVGAKSPLTRGYGEGEAGGDFGARLRWAGYDGVVITGTSDSPVYLWIYEDKVELRDASAIWGMEAFETQEAIRADVGDNLATAAMIGPGGERLVRFACISVGTHNYVGRAGLGAVMGAKKLKAVAVNGKLRLEAADQDQIRIVAKWLRDNYKTAAALWTDLGTPGLVRLNNAAGGLPTRNFQDGSFEGAENISGQTMAEKMVVDRWGCFACPIRCKRIVEVKEEGLTVSRKYGGPEYETLAGFGSNCGIDDLKVVAKANEICDRNSIDTISAGIMISGAMEAAEKGLLPAYLIKDLDLRFGSGKGLLLLLQQIIAREGLGEILAEGILGIEEKIGKEAATCFLHVKNQPLPLHEPRWKTGLGIGYTLSPTGADHQHNIHDPAYAAENAPGFAAVRNMGILDPVNSLELSPAKARLFVYMTLARSITNSLCTCNFTPFSLDSLVGLVKGMTGWNFSNWELVKASERALNMAVAFNVREGINSADDVLPDRFFEPLKSGALAGMGIDRQIFMDTRNLAYDMLGWDRKTGGPKRWKLYELGLGWVADDLKKIGCLPD